MCVCWRTCVRVQCRGSGSDFDCKASTCVQSKALKLVFKRDVSFKESAFENCELLTHQEHGREATAGAVPAHSGL